jgi:hypothetical protein
MQEHIGSFVAVAQVLSGLTLMLLVWFVVDLWRRSELPAIAYGGITLNRRRTRYLWLAFLVGGLMVSAAEDPIATRGRTLEDWELEDGSRREGMQVGSSLFVPLPFYHFDRRRTHVEGHLVEEEVSEAVVIPWSFLGALVAYVVLVLRWNPESRWALRILKGRKWKKHESKEAVRVAR